MNLVFEGEGTIIIIIMGDTASVGLYTLNGCTYVMIKQSNDSSSGGELHLGMESFSSLMVLLKGLESELLKNQIPIDTNFNNGIVSCDPNALLNTMLESATSSVQYDPSQPSMDMTYNPSSIISADTPKRTRKRRSDAGIRKKPQPDLTLTTEVENGEM